MKNFTKAALSLSVAALLGGCNGTGPNVEKQASDDAVPVYKPYREQYRPQFHYTPKKNWMNDPNGLVYHDGEYHMFYQYNPYGDRWGHMSWGHAISTDLVHWEEQGVAILEDEDYMIFSGSAVVDHGNTTGFGTDENPAMVAIYTGHSQVPGGDQNQQLAYSTDNGRTWTKYEGNPVLDENMEHFRDPKVVWHEESEQWLMIITLSEDFAVNFYGSPNLKDWTLLSQFTAEGAPVDKNWECPDMWYLPIDGDPNNKRWVLEVDLGDGSIAGGSGGMYFIGDFDGETFTTDTSILPDSAEGPHQFVDFGADYYAAVSWSNVPEDDGRALWVGWMNNWDYANYIPTHPWRSSQSIPRSVGLTEFNGGLAMAQQPVEELKALRTREITAENQSLSNNRVSLTDSAGIYGQTLELKVTFEPEDADEFGIDVLVGDGEKTTISYNVHSEEISFDRSQSGDVDFHEKFSGVHVAPMPLDDGKVELHIFVDWSSVEVFAHRGAVVFSNKVFPHHESKGVEVFSRGGTTRISDIQAWPLKSIWQ
ncbi:glycoside hydrolase family 32 protein [Marinimicrobium alkaliphilum]|uniref:glycoside hydrolase family 32 protein n=1 Tax=Marinimicrobium alkaliphilum TaxID=2202654 RepID=UPI000DBA0292|nr:glycoside hydrolase family 32 protein [Marinimicrobium alkaliphilum]